MTNDPGLRLEVTPIGFVRGEKQLKFEAPHQPDETAVESHQIVLNEGMQFELALQDLAGFDRIWLVFWFHRNTTWRPRVMPPRGPAKRRGVFATRSPHRPNPIGMTCVRLISIDGRVLTVGPIDLVDGTPILDIKPYITTVDSFPESSLGWIGEMERELLEAPGYEVEASELATRQLDWLRQQGVDFWERALGLLKIDPRPHRTRRILEVEPGLFRMACGAWRLYFVVEGLQVTIQYLAKGYADESLQDPTRPGIPHREVQIAFSKQLF